MSVSHIYYFFIKNECDVDRITSFGVLLVFNLNILFHVDVMHCGKSMYDFYGDGNSTFEYGTAGLY